MRLTSLSLTHSTSAVLTLSVLLMASPALATTTFNNGIVNPPINAASADIEILDGPGNAPTTVIVAAGAVVGTNGTSSVTVRNNSIYQQTGGKLDDELFLFNNSHADVSGGEIVDDITTNDNSTADIHSVVVDDDLEANGNSVMNVFGGSFDEDVESFLGATINIHGGTFQTGTDGADVEATGNSTINIFGGTFGTGDTNNVGALNAFGDGVVNLHGGDISGLPQGMVATGNGVINVYALGGQPASINTAGNGVINFYDGSLQNLLTAGSGVVRLFGSDGSLNNISAQGTTVIKIFGKNFSAFNGAIPLSNGLIPFGSGNLTGDLADGTHIMNVPFIRNIVGVQAQIRIVPEPTAFVLLSLALAGLAVRRRHR